MLRTAPPVKPVAGVCLPLPPGRFSRRCAIPVRRTLPPGREFALPLDSLLRTDYRVQAMVSRYYGTQNKMR